MNTGRYSWFYSLTTHVPVKVLKRVGLTMSQRKANAFCGLMKKTITFVNKECLPTHAIIRPCLSLSVVIYFFKPWPFNLSFVIKKKLIRCRHVKKCPARKGIALRNVYVHLPISFLLSFPEPTSRSFLSCFDTVRPLLRPLSPHVPCPVVTFPKIRLSNDVLGGDWSWKSDILGEKERDKYCSLDFFRRLFCNLCCKTKVTVGHAHQNSDVTGIRHQLYTGCWKRLTRFRKKKNMASQRIQHRSSNFWNISQRWLAVLSYRGFETVYRFHLQGYNFFLDYLTL